MVSGSQDRPPIEGQFITYTCPPGFILTGLNASVCMGNREWEPDPREVDCIGNELNNKRIMVTITQNIMFSSPLLCGY